MTTYEEHVSSQEVGFALSGTTIPIESQLKIMDALFGHPSAN